MESRLALTGTVAVIVGLVTAACSDVPEPADPVPQPSAAAGSSDAPAREPGADALEPGTGRVDGDAGSLTLVTNRAALSKVLAHLAREFGFGLKLTSKDFFTRSVTIEVRGVPLEEALAALLQGIPYSIRYGVDDEDGARFLAHLTVGDPATRVAEQATPAEAATPRPRERRRDRPELPEPDPNAFEEEQLAYREQLTDEDPDVRQYAANWIYADAAGIATLLDVVSNDPDPRVRATAASTLGDAAGDEEAAAVRALLVALEDTDPRVVVAALEGLEWVADETVIPELMPLLSHPSPEVRERTVEAVEWLE